MARKARETRRHIHRILDVRFGAECEGRIGRAIVEVRQEGEAWWRGGHSILATQDLVAVSVRLSIILFWNGENPDLLAFPIALSSLSFKFNL